VKVAAEHYKVLIDNPAVRVLKITYSPGAKSPMHSHPDSMLVSLQDSKVRFALPDGKTQDMEVGKETAAYTPATTHAPTDVGTTPVEAILVEFKAKEPGTASVPTSRPGMQINVLAESPRAIAFKTTAAADFHEDPGTTHDYDQVVISMGASDMSLAIEGKPAVTKWQRGTVQFIGRGVKHESKNTSGRPIEFAIVAIK
jgi:quercetin dioxygenase-like cupin family protein